MKRHDYIFTRNLFISCCVEDNKTKPVSLEVLMRICQVFHCDIGDICEVILDED